MINVVRLGILKAGCIGTLSLLEFLLDERAERTDIDVRVIGSGSKIGLVQCKEIVNTMLIQTFDLIVFVGPSQTTSGPTEIRSKIAATGIPAIVISDSVAKKITQEIEAEGLGYIVVEADSMIGARREFLDPTEVAVYNSDVLKVLAITGALNVVISEIDKVIESIKEGKKPELPKIVVDGEKAIWASEFSNPYAKAKAQAAYEIAKRVAVINTEACFKIQDWKTYLPAVATAHEMMRAAAKMADEAREIEKKSDSVHRRPHFDDGTTGAKKSLMEKPRKEE